MSRSPSLFTALLLLSAACAVDDTTAQRELAVEVEADWAQLGRTPRHTAWNPHETAIDAATVGSLSVAWTCCERGRRMDVAVWQGQVFVTNADPYREFPSPTPFALISAFDAATGAELWRAPLGQGGELASVVSRPAVGYGRLFAQDENRFATLSTRTGAFVAGPRGLPAFDVAASSPVASRRGLYLDVDDGSFGRELRAFTEDGTQRWFQPVPGGRVREPAIASERIWTAVDNSRLQAFAVADGAPLWTTPDSGAVIGSPSISGGRVHAVAYPHTLLTYAETTGALLWTATFTGGVNTPTPAPPDPPAVDDQRVYIAVDKAAGGIAVGAFDARTGARRWGVIVGASRRSGLLAVAGGVVYVPAADGDLTALDAATGRTVTTLRFGGPVRSPAVAGGQLIVPTDGAGVTVLAPP
jgi:outer membrane protein assembly factor BamB